MAAEPSLCRLLSQALIAYTIEFDNEFEHRMSKTYARPFRVSIVMWSNFMRFVRPDGTTVGEIAERGCMTRPSVASVVGGMERWRYVTVDHDPADGAPPLRKGFGSARGVKRETVIRPSQVGALALKAWDGLAGEIERRWASRLGDARVDDLRSALASLEARVDLVMPHFLPILGGGGLFAASALEEGASGPDDDLAAMLSRVLLAFTLEFEKDHPVSLPIASNVLRVVGEGGVRVRDLPLMAGVSKEAVSMSMTWLKSAGYIQVAPDPAARGKVVHLTPKGADVQDGHVRRLEGIETRWEERFGTKAIGALRESLAAILDQPGGADGPLSAGLVTPEGGWRGSGRYEPLTAAFIESPIGSLPQYPMVLHRGGWPDGS